MVMKLTTTNIVLIMSALIVISAGTTFAFTQGLVDNNSRPSGALFTGNVKVTQYDGTGNIIAYRQSDNHITAQGMELIMRQIFADVNQSSAAWDIPPTGADGQVRWMEIGVGGEWELLFNDTDLRNTVIASGMPGCTRFDAGIVNVSSHKYPIDPAICFDTDGNPPRGGVPSTCLARMNVTASGSFSGMQCSGALDIDEAGIFNDPTTATGEMFARNTFGGVVLNAPDTLALDWEFTFTDS